MKKVLFVCLGNICRSPAAEGIMWHLLESDPLSGRVEVDSAGTSGVHAGERADARMRRHADHRGISLTSISRGVSDHSDFEYFDYVIAMDSSNYRDLKSRCSEKHQEKIRMLSEFCHKITRTDVPDPYYGGDEGFEFVLDMVYEGCVGLLEEIRKDLELK